MAWSLRRLQGPWAGYAAVFADYFGLSAVIPCLPFFVEGSLGRDADSAAFWAGVAFTAQYTSVIVGNVAWGVLADSRLGMRLVLSVCLLGDVVTFAATGFVRSVGALVAVRAAAGFMCPLSVGQAYTFRAVGAEGRVAALSRYGVCGTVAYMSGSALGGVISDYVGFRAVALLTAAVAFGATLLAAFSPEPRAPPPEQPREQREPPLPEQPAPAEQPAAAPAPPARMAEARAGPATTDVGAVRTVREAACAVMRTPHFMTFAGTTFTNGWVMNLNMVLGAVALKDAFGFSETEVGVFFMVSMGVVGVISVVIFPRLPGIKLDPLPLVARTTAATVALQLLLASPVAYVHWAPFCVFLFVSIQVFCMCQLSNHTRIALLVDRFGKEAMGSVVSAGRTINAVGRALAPVATAALWIRHRWLPYVVSAALAAAPLALLLVVYGPKCSEAPRASAAGGVAPGSPLPPPPRDECRPPCLPPAGAQAEAEGGGEDTEAPPAADPRCPLAAADHDKPDPP